MELKRQSKILSGIVLSIALVSICWIVVSEIVLQRAVESAAQAGWAVDISPDQQQRDVRLILALILWGIAVWSHKGTRRALVLFGLIFLLTEFASWVWPFSFNAFDRTSIEIHVVAGIVLANAALLWFLGVNRLIVSALAPVYLLSEYLFWYLETLMAKISAGVEELDPPTWLNNTLNGAHWWHLVILASTILLVGWQIWMILKQRSDGVVALKPV